MYLPSQLCSCPHNRGRTGVDGILVAMVVSWRKIIGPSQTTVEETNVSVRKDWMSQMVREPECVYYLATSPLHGLCQDLRMVEALLLAHVRY